MIAVADYRKAAEIRNNPLELFRLHCYVAESCARKLWATSKHKLRSKMDLDDLSQLCYTSLHMASVSYKPSMGRFENYAYRCCKNAMMDVLRCHRAEQSNFDKMANIATQSTQRTSDYSEALAEVNNLPHDMRQVVMMTYGLGGHREHTQKEIADKLGIGRTGVQLLISAARKTLAARLLS